MKAQALARDAVVAQRQIARDVATILVEQKRIFELALREQAFGQTRKKHDAEFAAARLVNRSDEDVTPAAIRRFAAEKTEPLAQHFGDFFKRGGTPAAPGFEIRAAGPPAPRTAPPTERPPRQKAHRTAPTGRTPAAYRGPA